MACSRQLAPQMAPQSDEKAILAKATPNGLVPHGPVSTISSQNGTPKVFQGAWLLMACSRQLAPQMAPQSDEKAILAKATPNGLVPHGTVSTIRPRVLV